MLSRSMTFFVSLALSMCWCATSAQATPPARQTVAPADPIKGRLLIGGGGTTRRFVQPLVDAFTKLHPDVSCELTLRGSATAPTGLGANEYNIGVMSRAMTPEEEATLKKETGHDVVEVAIAIDAILVLVNKENPVEGITLPQLDALYGTKKLAGYKKDIKTWADLGVKGDLARVEISPYGILEEQNGTVETFRRLVLRGGPLNPSIHSISFPDREYGQAVAADKSGISYNIDHPLEKGARAIGVAAKEGDPFVLADPKTISTGKYPLWRNIYVYHCDPANRAVVEFLRFTLSKDGQGIIATHFATPLSAQMAEEQRKKLSN
jgi:phosphate transport system substrate-binding protein